MNVFEVGYYDHIALDEETKKLQKKKIEELTETYKEFYFGEKGKGLKEFVESLGVPKKCWKIIEWENFDNFLPRVLIHDISQIKPLEFFYNKSKEEIIDFFNSEDEKILEILKNFFGHSLGKSFGLVIEYMEEQIFEIDTTLYDDTDSSWFYDKCKGNPDLEKKIEEETGKANPWLHNDIFYWIEDEKEHRETMGRCWPKKHFEKPEKYDELDPFDPKRGDYWGNLVALNDGWVERALKQKQNESEMNDSDDDEDNEFFYFHEHDENFVSFATFDPILYWDGYVDILKFIKERLPTFLDIFMECLQYWAERYFEGKDSLKIEIFEGSVYGLSFEEYPDDFDEDFPPLMILKITFNYFWVYKLKLKDFYDFLEQKQQEN